MAANTGSGIDPGGVSGPWTPRCLPGSMQSKHNEAGKIAHAGWQACTWRLVPVQYMLNVWEPKQLSHTTDLAMSHNTPSPGHNGQGRDEEESWSVTRSQDYL